MSEGQELTTSEGGCVNNSASTSLPTGSSIYAGSDLYGCIDIAIKQATDTNEQVSFEFNGIIIIINANSKKENVSRDYFNAHLMGWKTIGPDYRDEYTREMLAEIEAAKQKQEEERIAQEKAWRAEEARKRAEFAKTVEGIEMDFSNKEIWDKGLANNEDPYGRAVYVFAEQWAKLMQKHMAEGKTLQECADADSHAADTEGITGFMYGCAVNVLFGVWKHGEELRVWHNKQYNHLGEGVVNPAVLTISCKDEDGSDN